MNPANIPYSNSQIVRAEKRLGLWQKVGSTTSDQAYLPINFLKRRMHWHEPFPHGILGEKTDKIIDINKAMFKLESQDCKRGKATQVVPIKELNGDETGASIGDQKEDELKKRGISLLSFKKKNYV
jgi:hypothetical protein